MATTAFSPGGTVDESQGTTRAIAAPDLAPDEAEGALDFAGRCHWQIVCYPGGLCRRRKVCW